MVIRMHSEFDVWKKLYRILPVFVYHISDLLILFFILIAAPRYRMHLWGVQKKMNLKQEIRASHRGKMNEKKNC